MRSFSLHINLELLIRRCNLSIGNPNGSESELRVDVESVTEVDCGVIFENVIRWVFQNCLGSPALSCRLE